MVINVNKNNNNFDTEDDFFIPNEVEYSPIFPPLYGRSDLFVRSMGGKVLCVKDNRLQALNVLPTGNEYRPIDIYDLGLHNSSSFSQFWGKLSDLFYTDISFLLPESGSSNELVVFCDNYGENFQFVINLNSFPYGYLTSTGKVLPWTEDLAELFYEVRCRTSKKSFFGEHDSPVVALSGYLVALGTVLGLQGGTVEGEGSDVVIKFYTSSDKVTPLVELNLLSGTTTVYLHGSEYSQAISVLLSDFNEHLSYLKSKEG